MQKDPQRSDHKYIVVTLPYAEEEKHSSSNSSQKTYRRTEYNHGAR